MSYQSWGLFRNVEFMIHLGAEFGVFKMKGNGVGLGVQKACSTVRKGYSGRGTWCDFL